jgi:hypothetical protein
MNCLKCDAELADGEDCRGRFDLCLALEYENPSAYGAVHHLTVTCYMLQHNAYSHQAWLEARTMLDWFVRQGVEPAEFRKQNRDHVDSGRRKWSITNGPRFPQFDRISWTRTIADVRLDNPDNYCADMRLWAASVLEDTEPWIPESNPGDPTVQR